MMRIRLKVASDNVDTGNVNDDDSENISQETVSVMVLLLTEVTSLSKILGS